MEPRTLSKFRSEDREGYARLEVVASMLTTFSKRGYKYETTDCYLDFGQDWMWTTICLNNEDRGCQVLSPNEWRAIMLADSPAELAEIAVAIMSDKYFPENW